MRVLVPLGRRTVTGFCVRLHRDTPAIAVKPVRDLPDADVVFSGTILRLAEWVHQYYFCPLADALKAALPQGIDIESEQYIHTLVDDLEMAKQRYVHSKKKITVLETLQTGQYISASELQAVTGYKNLSLTLHELEQDGFIRIESVLTPPKVSKKKILAVRLLSPWTQSAKVKELLGV